jgi:hypothetical protein
VSVHKTQVGLEKIDGLVSEWKGQEVKKSMCMRMGMDLYSIENNCCFHRKSKGTKKTKMERQKARFSHIHTTLPLERPAKALESGRSLTMS